MAMGKCRECGKDVSDKAEICPHCGIKDPVSSKENVVTFFFLLAIIVFIYFFFFYSGESDTNSDDVAQGNAKVKHVPSCAQGQQISGKYYISGSDVNFRQGPSTESKQVVNEKATQVLGSTQYRTLWKSNVLQGYCETNEWLYGEIIEADGGPVDWGTGWVHKDFITDKPSDDYLTGLLWDIGSEDAFNAQEKALIRKGALKVLAEEPACKNVITGYRSADRPGAYFVTCTNEDGEAHFNVWFTPEQLASGESLALPEPHPEELSRLTCIEMIKRSVNHPSTLDIHEFIGYATVVYTDRSRRVFQRFSAKNSFDLELEYMAHCDFKPDGEFDFAVNEVR
ncbi:hypothetical protein J6I90_06475 [Pseudidiomarina sp. 1APP75-32.1]|uniref:SH3b domain-containing protein n=1 Tax=Pseudidiomarina terrestris TaxID=2820060 RepID=A0AAW7QWE7_9GAMM|nr:MULTISPECIES: hypothetical protein [unclassified Pseudidiomarina]MDN7124522.1 hypothetical protein [Pseudidiomarina sp. 1APP75-32.1]MDN7129187.1 hypothetical protein [Pseudidiomarina sp. 1APR75-15]